MTPSNDVRNPNKQEDIPMSESHPPKKPGQDSPEFPEGTLSQPQPTPSENEELSMEEFLENVRNFPKAEFDPGIRVPGRRHPP